MAEATLLGLDQREPWREFVAGAPAGDVLQTMEWGEIKAQSGWEALPLALRDGERIVACALMLKRPLPWPFGALVYCPRGPIVDPADREMARELLGAMRETATRQGATLLRVDPAWPDQEQAAGLLQEAGFWRVGEGGGFGGVQPRYVMKTDLTADEDELLASFKQKWRYNIRLAGRKGVVIDADPDREALHEFHRVLQVTAERDGFMVRDLSYYEALWDKLVSRGLARLLLARYEGELIAGILCFLLGRQCWYVYGASGNDHRDRMPNHLLQWTAMRWAKSQGCTVYDFRGVAPETPEGEASALYGLNRFKRGFAAEVVEYVGEFDLPLRPARYGAFRWVEPRRQRIRKWLRAGRR